MGGDWTSGIGGSSLSNTWRLDELSLAAFLEAVHRLSSDDGAMATFRYTTLGRGESGIALGSEACQARGSDDGRWGVCVSLRSVACEVPGLPRYGKTMVEDWSCLSSGAGVETGVDARNT